MNVIASSPSGMLSAGQCRVRDRDRECRGNSLCDRRIRRRGIVLFSLLFLVLMGIPVMTMELAV